MEKENEIQTANEVKVCSLASLNSAHYSFADLQRRENEYNITDISGSFAISNHL